MVDYMCDVSRGQLRTQLKIKLVLRRRDANWEADQDVVHQNQIRETPSNLGSLAKFTSLGGLFLSYTIFSEIILKKNLQRISLLDLLFFSLKQLAGKGITKKLKLPGWLPKRKHSSHLQNILPPCFNPGPWEFTLPPKLRARVEINTDFD